MRRGLLPALCAAFVLSLAAPAIAAPTLTLTPACDRPNTPVGAEVSGGGFPPNQAINVIAIPSSTTASFTEARTRTGTDPNGNLSPVFFGSASPFGVLRVQAFEIHDDDLTVDPDEALLATSFIDNPCAVRTLTKDQCKNGGWREFGFKNQGECVAFVERRPKP